MRNSVGEYIAPRRLTQGRELLQRTPIVIGHGSRCAAPQALFTEDAAGVPVLVICQDGSIKAFLDVCRDRGRRGSSAGATPSARDGDGAHG